MKKYLFTLLLPLILLLWGCQPSPGDKLLGKWISTEKNLFDGSPTLLQMVIEKNGDNFIVTYRSTTSYTSKPKEEKISASLTADGKLSLDVNAFVSNMLVCNEKDGTLLWRGISFKKETPENLAQIKEQQQKFNTEKQRSIKE
jgi:hypothetical protein